MKMIIVNLFLICMFTNANLAEILKKIGGKSVIKFISVDFMEFVFSKSAAEAPL